MTRRMITGNGAAAWGARLAHVDYVPAFPITPQTEIIETISNWVESGEMNTRMVMFESEHSMITAAGSAATTGVRVFTASSSQGLLYGMEMIYTVAGWRAPFVMMNVSRGLSAPITLESDHNDIMATRDSGFLQLHCATCQEVLDNVLLAYRLAEHPDIRLPVFVNLDGFYLSFTREPVTIPEAVAAAEFVGEFDPENIRFRASNPESQAVAVLGGSPYSYFRYETHLANLNGVRVYQALADEFADRFDRQYAPVETYRCDDARYVFFMTGSFATKAKDAVDRLRENKVPIGLVQLRMMRPYPEEMIKNVLAGKDAVAVIDQNISMGKGGVLHQELTSALYGDHDAPRIVASFIGGLGGRDISAEEFYQIATLLKKAVKKEMVELKKLQAIAHIERTELRDHKQV